MATASDLVVTLVEHTWELSITVMPALFIILFLYYFLDRRGDGTVLETVVSGQRDVALAFSEYLVTGLVLGGIVNFVVDGFVPGVVVVAAFFVFAVSRGDVPEPKPLDLRAASAYVHLVWVAVLFVSGVTVLLMLVTVFTAAESGWALQMLQRVVSLVFYAAVFWEL